MSDEKNSHTVHAYSDLRLIVKPSAPFADMSPPISYKAFYLSNLLKLEDFFFIKLYLNKENQVHNKRNPQKLCEKDSIYM